MRLLDSGLRLITVDAFDLDTELDIEHEAPFAILAEADFCRHSCRGVKLALAEDQPQSAIEASSVACSEELLGVRRPTLPSKLLRSTELDIEVTIITYCVTFTAATGDTSRSRVECFECHSAIVRYLIS